MKQQTTPTPTQLDGQAHHYIWRHALEIAKSQAKGEEGTAYWERELQAFDRIFPALVRQNRELEDHLDAVTRWKEEGERMFGDPRKTGAVFQLAVWWADRPWRKTAAPASQQPQCHKKANDYCQCSRKAMLCDGVGPTPQPQAEAVPSDVALDAERYRRWRYHACYKPAVAAKLLSSAIHPAQIDAAIDALPTAVAVNVEREDRYLVFKYKDVAAALNEDQKQTLHYLSACVDAHRRRQGKDILQALVVEKDWPEFDATWALIAARIASTEKPTPRKVGSE